MLRRESVPWRGLLAAVLAALVVVSGVVQTAGAREGARSVTLLTSEDFCGSRAARDYARPLSQMRPIHRIPSSGKLQFAPPGITLEARGGRVVVGGGLVGFGFSDDAVGQVRDLQWDVLLRLVKVNSRGEALVTLESTRRRIGSVRGAQIQDLLLKVTGTPAFYRIDILFRRIGSGNLLGKYSSYLRVVRPRFSARLLVSAPVVHRGERVSTRLANLGTEPISSISPDWGFAVEHFTGDGWVPAASNPPPQKQKPIGQKLFAGQMDDCVRLRIPSFEEPGRYRFSMAVDRSRRIRPEDRVVAVTAEFEIDGRVLK